jgi:hypothetical protein
MDAAAPLLAAHKIHSLRHAEPKALGRARNSGHTIHTLRLGAEGAWPFSHFEQKRQ